MKNGYQSIECPFCFVHPDTQLHSVQCVKVKEKITMKGNYEEIFLEKISKDIAETLMKITNLRKDIL